MEANTEAMSTDAGARSEIHSLRASVRSASALGGVLVLLVTDLQEFTVLVERLGDRHARAVIRDHNRLLRDNIARRDGVEVTHTGDGIIAAFRSVIGALHCAQDIQRDLGVRLSESTALFMRIGVNAGEPLPEDGRLFGSCLNVAVRVCDMAQAQQILVTDVVRQLAHGGGFEFGASKVVKLKGFQRDVQVHQLGVGNARR